MTVSYKVHQQAMFVVSPRSRRSNKGSPASPIVSRNQSTGRVSWADLPSDIIVHVDGVGFALHKSSLSSRSGRIRKMIAEYEGQGQDPYQLKLANVPGGPDGFEMAAKFCYGIKFEIDTSNVILLRCVAGYLEMTEEYGGYNLISRTELFLNEVVLQSFRKSVKVLHACQKILSVAEDAKITSRCIDTIASKVCSSNSTWHIKENGTDKSFVEWWVDDLTILPIDLFQRVLMAMKCRGLQASSIVSFLMHYTDRYLGTLTDTNGGLHVWDQKGCEKEIVNSALAHDQRIVVERVVNLLPAERDLVATDYLFSLLRAAIRLDSTLACRLDLEKRIGARLEQATVEDLLIPSLSHRGDTLFDIDIVHRLLVHFLQQHIGDSLSVSRTPVYDSDDPTSASQMAAIMKVAEVIDTYLAEVAPDANLKASKFISLAELIPTFARPIDDSIYRAIDVYLKAHPTLSDIERKRICKLMDCQKLSPVACSHAAQNERLPVNVMVQVLYFEQLRLRSALSGTFAEGESLHPVCEPHQLRRGTVSATISPRENCATLKKENDDLRLEVTRMRMRLSDLESHHPCDKASMEKTSSSKKFFGSVSKTFNKINPFARSNTKDGNQVAHGTKSTRRRRRHSLS